jgi:hypothetical protein
MKLAKTAAMESAQGLPDADLPELFRLADDTSVTNQNHYTFLLRVQLLFLVIGAGAGMFVWKTAATGSTLDLAGFIAAIAFLLGVFFQTTQIIRRPSRLWYDGRAVAESAKKLAWLYAVGGNPFGIGGTNVDQRLLEKYGQILEDINNTRLALAVHAPAYRDGDQITTRMKALRAAPQEQRREAYRVGRLKAQHDWYLGKAQISQRNASWLNFLLWGTEIIGVVAAFLKAAGVIELNLLGLVGTLAAVITTWLGVKQYETLSRSYTVTALELSLILDQVGQQHTEAEWARFVKQAEDAISREHSSWRSNHDVESRAYAAEAV